MNQPYDLGHNNLLALGLRMCAVLLAVLIVTVTSCTAHRDYQRSVALTKGADPLGVSCVFDDATISCTLTAASRPTREVK
jgi:hypothetical protein